MRVRWSRSDVGSTRIERALYASGFSIFDSALDEIVATIGARPAESGGALLGLNSASTVVSFVFDPSATTTGSTYVPSRELTIRVQEHEVAADLQFKGVVHSHPGTFDSPSGPDHDSFTEGLVANPELARYLAPIITFEPGRPANNKVQIGPEAWASFYVARRTRSSGVQVNACMPRVIPFARDCRMLADRLGVDHPIVRQMTFNDEFHVVTELTLPDGTGLLLAASSGYPEVAPFMMWHDPENDQTKQLTPPWFFDVPTSERLVRSLTGSCDGPISGAPRLTYRQAGLRTRPAPDDATILDRVPVVEFESGTGSSTAMEPDAGDLQVDEAILQSADGVPASDSAVSESDRDLPLADTTGVVGPGDDGDPDGEDTHESRHQEPIALLVDTNAVVEPVSTRVGDVPIPTADQVALDDALVESSIAANEVNEEDSSD